MLLSTLFNYQGNNRPLNPTGWTKTLQCLVGAGLLILFSSSAFSYPTYEGCKSCHGSFPGDPYVSNKDGSRWNTDLMDGHEAFVSGNCDACHKSGPKGEVFLNFSSDSTFSMGCIGCHGRSEDINNSCTGIGGGTEVNCGGGAGLRKHHETEVGSGTCSSCHSSDPSPVGENIAPFNYGKSGITMVDSCDADGTESQYGASGLDNDGDGLTDAADPDCQANTPPTQPGTLSASAITVNSATVSWVASTDADGDPITYLVEYRRNGDASWTSAGSTGTTSRSLSGLDSAQSYDVRVTPTDGVDTGPARTTLNLFQTDALNSAPTRPGTLSASAITVNSATVSWVASTDADGDPITYLVEYRRNGDASWTSAGSTGTTSRSLSGLDPAQSYDVRVTPTDGMDTGPARTTLNLFQTDALNSAPTQPGTLSASAITADSATVSWVASTDADGDPITYLVEYRRNGDVPWTSAGSTGTTSRSLGGLDSGQPYDVRVTPTDGMDAGPARTTLNLFETVFVNTPPTQPGPLSATSVTSDSAVVNWVASTDVDDDAITYLVEYRRNGDVPWTSAGSTSNTSQSLSGLDPAQSYDVQVTPNDATDDGTPRSALNLFQTFAAGEIIFKDGFEGVP
jgi:hypothetical protein